MTIKERRSPHPSGVGVCHLIRMEFTENEKLILIHFGELWLKGGNRNMYISKLYKNLREKMLGENAELQKQYDRFLIRLNSKSNVERISGKIGKTFGISNYEIAYVTKPDVRHICRLSARLLKNAGAKSAKISAHRSYKQLAFNSADIVKSLAKELEKIKIEPRLSEYDKEIYINVTKECAFVYMDKLKGAGGVPTGVGGKCIVLLSFGIDSPVAAWYAMKRGMTPVYVHLHAFANAAEINSTKAPKILSALSEFYPYSKIYYVPSHIFDLASTKARSGSCALVLLKHFMLKLAEKIADIEHAKVIFTGESLGQVASQTAENICAEEQGVRYPVLRPLIGCDKEEIISLAKKIGTYDLSIEKYRDVCSLNAKSPKLNVGAEEIEKLDSAIKIDSVVSKSLKSCSKEQAKASST